MGLWDKLKDKVEKKKAEVEKKAMERATEMAIQKTKDTARNALDNMGKTIENAIFGSDSEKSDTPNDEEAPTSDDERKAEQARPKEKARARSDAPKAKEAKEPLSRDYDKFVKDRAQKERDLEKAVDDDLAALKKKLGKQ
jgi:hypothetical protein